MKRRAAVAGIFYPRRCGKLEAMIAAFNEREKEVIEKRALFKHKPSAIIVPHAGYIYSGFTANIAYRVAVNRKPKRIIVIGPSHHYYFEGISGAMYERFETPCGDIPIDTTYLKRIEKAFPVTFNAKAHRKEHSTEVQMPFVKHYFPNAKVIELVYGKVDPLVLAKLIYALMKEKENLVVISTDLSHFYTLEEAKKRDNICLNAVVKRDPAILDRGCEACGFTGLKALLMVVKRTGLRTTLLDYRTSANASGDPRRVVGYMSAVVE